MECPYCHQEHPQGTTFCPSTGQKISTSFSKKESTQQNDILCPVCSSPVKKGGSYCPRCGSPLQVQTHEPTGSPAIPPMAPQKLRAILFVILIIVGLGLVTGGAIILKGSIPDINIGFLTKERPTLEVRSTIDISKYERTEAPNNNPLSSVEPLNITLTPESTLFKLLQANPTALPPPSVATTTLTYSPAPSSVPIRTIAAVDLRVNEKDQAEMVFIPAGEFLMGTDPDWDPFFWGAEGPSHRVYLDGYLIYRFEVTNGMYQDCVTAGACPRPEQKESRTRPEYYGNDDYSDYPVIYVDYTSALSYCRWVGGRLPTEAEWERAARGDIDDRLFPWGSTAAEGSQANFCDRGCPGQEIDYDKEDGFNDTAPIGSYPDGMSLYGLFDTAGNVWEWTFDYFNAGYYQASPEKNPKGPQSSQYRVIRGGGWNNPSSGIRIVQRTGVNPDMALDTLGFRCAVASTNTP